MILVLAFGTVTAMALPIITAILGLLTTLALITAISHLTAVPTVSPTLATMIGLGVGIDYSLFIVTKHKLQLGHGIEMNESIARATATSGGAVLFAGVTVVIALCSLVVAGIPLVSTLGYTAAIAVAVSVLAAITLLPALLGAIGEHINSLRVHIGRTHPDDQQPHGWARMARAVGRNPWPYMIGSTVLLLVLAFPLINLRLGQSDNSVLPKSTTSRQAYDAIAGGFGAGSNGPLLIAVKFPTPAQPAQAGGDPTTDPRLTSLQNAIAKTAERAVGRPGDGRSVGHRRRVQRRRKDVAVGRPDRGSREQPPRHGHPQGGRRLRPDRVRRRPDGRLHRPGARRSAPSCR